MARGERETMQVGRLPADATPSSDSSATACNRNLIRAGLLAQARVEDVVRPYGLSYPLFQVLTIIERAGEPLAPCNISDRMVVPRNTLTHILDVLERQELVRRERHPHHRGMVLVELTERGRSVVAEIRPSLHARDAEWWSSFSEDERHTLVALLLRAQEALAEPRTGAQTDRHHGHGHHQRDVTDPDNEGRSHARSAGDNVIHDDKGGW
jgi:DNA-binding MarR family transcriptional regulator